MKNLWMSWSSGKDSAFALSELLRHPLYEVTGLFTTVNEDYQRVAMHATRVGLLRRQAKQLGLPLEIVPIPSNCTPEMYEIRFNELLSKAKSRNVTAMGFGDIYLSDVRSHREAQLKGTCIEAIFPLWEWPTMDLAREITGRGFEAFVTCVDPKALPESFCGRKFDASLIAALPAKVDPCGENGEFHTFVYDSPNFKQAINCEVGRVVEREGLYFADVIAKGPRSKF